MIENAALERKKREESKKHTQFAIRFQANLRRYLARKKWQEVFRKEYDEKLSQITDNVNVNLLSYLAKRLIFFYSHSRDVDRIIFFNKILCENKSTVIQQQKLHQKQWNCWLLTIFKHNSAMLSSITGTDNSQRIWSTINSIAKLFDEYLSCSNMADSQFVNECWYFIVMSGHFKNLRSLFDKIDNLAANSEAIESICKNLLLSPLSLENLSKEHSKVFARSFMMDFLVGPLSDSMKKTIFPRIYSSRPIHLNVVTISESFDSAAKSMDSYSFLWLFYSTLKILKTQISSIPVKTFFTVIRAFSEKLSAYLKSKNTFNFEEKHTNDEDEDDEELPNDSEDKSETEFKSFIEEMFEILNDKDFCNTIVRYMDNILEKDKESLVSLCHLCHSMLIFSPVAIHKNRLLHSLAFNSNFLRDLWKYISTENTVSLFDSVKTYLHLLSHGAASTQNSSVDWLEFIPSLTLFCALFNYFLQTLDDVEFFNEYNNNPLESNTDNLAYNYSVLPFKLNELVSMTSIIRDSCISLIELAYQGQKFANMTSRMFGQTLEIEDNYTIQCWRLLLRSTLKLLRHIYARDTRKQFCPKMHWISPNTYVQILPANYNLAIQQRGQLYQEFRGIRHLGREEINLFGSPISVKDIVSVTIVQELPFVVPFHDRVKIMQSLITYEKRADDQHLRDIIMPGNSISIRRNYIYEDAFDKLSVDKFPDLKKQVRISLISTLGMEETGIDGGGLFREFLSETLKAAFDPNRGFFRLTLDGLLYPNPAVQLLVSDHHMHYYFIGRLLGKAIYENMLTELPLAPFFLAKLLNSNSDVEINHLASLDPVLYKNLISLKNYRGDVSELGLDFSVMNCELGTNIIENLKPDGANIAVTNSNRIEYIHLMSDYKLNKQIRSQCNAFKNGFYNVVNFDWITMFDPRELQILLSGAPTPIDLEDLKNHTVYSNGYSVDHPVIKVFWEVVAEFSEHEKRQLLKFITSCSRPPLLGFKDLFPKLCIQNAGKETKRLPTSSTCMNLLKLPEVYDKSMMKEKLAYSINAGAGFELS